MTANIPASVGEICRLETETEQTLSEVIGMNGEEVKIMPYTDIQGINQRTRVIPLREYHRIPVGANLVGRVINAVGQPVDGLGELNVQRLPQSHFTCPSPLDRKPISEPFVTGQKTIDGLLTLGQGQRVGIFAGGGVGKSTLLGEIAKGSNSDLNIVAMIGERGREVLPFIKDCLGEEGLKKSIVIVSAADESPIMRVRAATSAASIASWFREQGLNVLFMLDSITRLAIAQRQLGLLLGEAATSRGYTPSVFDLLATVAEQLGNSDVGSITAIMTVLVEGDEMSEPVSDALRAILDGHILLSRKMANAGIFPAIDLLGSVSRLFNEVTNPEHQSAMRKVRTIMSEYEEVKEFVQIGAYKRGTSARIDRAIDLYPLILAYMRQSTGEFADFDMTRSQLLQVANLWNFE